MLTLFLSGDFLLHILCWLHFCLGSFSYTSRADFIFIWAFSLTHPVLASFLSGDFLLHIPWWLLLFFFYFISGEFLLHNPCWLHFYVGSFTYTSRNDFIFVWGVSVTHPVLTFNFIWGVSLTHPVLASFLNFLSGEFLLHNPCWV